MLEFLSPSLKTLSHPYQHPDLITDPTYAFDTLENQLIFIQDGQLYGFHPNDSHPTIIDPSLTARFHKVVTCRTGVYAFCEDGTVMTRKRTILPEQEVLSWYPLPSFPQPIIDIAASTTETLFILLDGSTWSMKGSSSPIQLYPHLKIIAVRVFRALIFLIDDRQNIWSHSKRLSNKLNHVIDVHFDDYAGYMYIVDKGIVVQCYRRIYGNDDTVMFEPYRKKVTAYTMDDFIAAIAVSVNSQSSTIVYRTLSGKLYLFDRSQSVTIPVPPVQ